MVGVGGDRLVLDLFDLGLVGVVAASRWRCRSRRDWPAGAGWAMLAFMPAIGIVFSAWHINLLSTPAGQASQASQALQRRLAG